MNRRYLIIPVFLLLTVFILSVSGAASPMIVEGDGPSLPEGGIVLVQPTNDIQPGDTVIYRYANGLQLPGHVISVAANQYTVRTADHTMTIGQRQVLGTPAGGVPFIGRLIVGIRTPLGFLALIVLLTGALIHEIRRSPQV